jgi:hypothetical protein
MIDIKKVSSKLYLLVFLMSFFIIGIGLYSIQEMKTMNLRTKNFYDNQVSSLKGSSIN